MGSCFPADEGNPRPYSWSLPLLPGRVQGFATPRPEGVHIASKDPRPGHRLIDEDLPKGKFAGEYVFSFLGSAHVG